MIDPARAAALLAMLMALTLAGRALLARQLPGHVTLRLALIWGAIFVAATLIATLLI